MSGHSKWATIHRQKELTDQKKGAAFTKIANAIIIAVRESGVSDPESNFKLRLAVEKARSLNMPKENIQRAIDRAAGKLEGGQIAEIMYEGYGPAGVGILVETATDNRQRTVQEIKNIFDKSGGSIASPGAVAFNFKKVGTLIVKPTGDKDETILKIIDLGVDDIEESDDNLEIRVSPENLAQFRDKLMSAGIPVESMEIEMKPLNMISVTDPKLSQQLLSLMEKLESLDDVQKVYANFSIPDELMQLTLDK